MFGFEDYGADRPDYQPATHGQAYTNLKELLRKHRRGKRVSLAHQEMVGRGGSQTERLQEGHPCHVQTRNQDSPETDQENGHRDPWDIVRIAKDPFHLQASVESLRGSTGTTLSEPEQLVEGFRRQYPLQATTSDPGPVVVTSPRTFVRAKETTLTAIYQALVKMSNNSAPGLDATTRDYQRYPPRTGIA